MKKKVLFSIVAVALFAFATFVSSANYSDPYDQIKSVDDPECKWATRETSSGWEAICITTGVGYTCTCGTVKKY